MAHEIENNQIAYAGEVPWHGIGAQMQPGQSAEDWLKAANLDWRVDMKPTYFEHEDGSFKPVPNRFALIRDTDQKVMTVASERWTPLQNSEVVEFMQRYVTAGGAELETVGALRDGKIVWGLAKLNHQFEIRPGDKVNGYLLFQSPHVVGKSIQVSTTTVRVVCANTMACAERSMEVNYRQNHLTEFDAEAAREAIAGAHEQLAAAERRWHILDKMKLSTEDAINEVLLPVYSPLAEKAEDSMAVMGILKSMAEAPGATEGTGYSCLAGITHWSDHVRGTEGSGRLKSVFSGDSHKQKLLAEKILMELAA